MDNCIFCKIAKGDIPKEFTYEDEDIMVFPDIHPQKPTHLLVIPKKHFLDVMDIEDDVLWGKIRQTLQKMVREFHLSGRGFKIVNNGGGAQGVDHVHFHLLAPITKEEA